MNVFRFSRLSVMTPADSDNAPGFKLQRFSFYPPLTQNLAAVSFAANLPITLNGRCGYNSPDIPLSLPVWIFLLIAVITLQLFSHVWCDVL